MKDVGSKPESLRSATASATLKAPPECIALLRSRHTEKGDPIATARIAGIMAAKRTDDILPLCHPLPLQHAEMTFAVTDVDVTVTAEVQTIAPTGVEMEALTGATVAALCLYDMLKPYCDQAELALTNAHLLAKTGGKSHFPRRLPTPLRAAVVDLAGIAEPVAAALSAAGFAPVDHHQPVDQAGALTAAVTAARDAGCACIVIAGGTSASGAVAQTLQPLLDAEMPGLLETVRAYGQRRRPVAMLETGIAGRIGDSLLFCLPADAAAADGGLTALMPGLVQYFGEREDTPGH